MRLHELAARFWLHPGYIEAESGTCRRQVIAVDFADGAAPALHCRRMDTFIFRLKAPRPTFALDMSDEEREIMGRHAAYWQPYIDSGQMVVFGPVLDASESWGLGVVEAENEDELRAFAADDPAVTSGIGELEIGKMLAGFVRTR
jgi:uncharacterized protein YciI